MRLHGGLLELLMGTSVQGQVGQLSQVYSSRSSRRGRCDFQYAVSVLDDSLYKYEPLSDPKSSKSRRRIACPLTISDIGNVWP